MPSRLPSALRSIAIALVGGMVTALLLWSQPLAVAASTLQIAPSADAYVESGTAANYGAATTLRIGGSPDVRSYLRFDLGSVSGTISQATLKVYANSASDAGYDVYRSDGRAWSESSLVYSSAPGIASAAGRTASFVAGTWTSVDVTAAVTAAVAGGSVVDLVLMAKDAKDANPISFGSRESANAPLLVLSTSSPGPAATRAP